MGMNLNRRIRVIGEDGKPILLALYDLLPTGFIGAFGVAPGTSLPGWLYCDGQSYLRADYPDLFATIGTANGAADGTHFNVPDHEGRILRGVDNGAGRDPDAASRTAMATGGNTGDNVGSVQADALQGHRHDVVRTSDGASIGQTIITNPGGAGAAFVTVGSAQAIEGRDPKTDGTHGTPRTSSETRGKNAGVSFYIKT